jgi:hypothetical protein
MKKLFAIPVILLSFVAVSYAQEKLIPVHRDVKYGYAFSEDGPLILPARYDDALYFEEGLAPVKMGEKWGYINEQGATVISFKYDYANIFTDGYALVGTSTGTWGKYKYGLINKAGVLVVPMKYDGLGDVEEGLISVVVGDKMGFMNIKGVMVIPLKFNTDQNADFAGGFAKINIGKKFEFIDKTGKVIAPAKYSAATDFKEGMAVVGVDTNWNKKTGDGSKETTAWGFINQTGKEVIPCKYENVSSFDNGFANAYLDGYKFKIDKTGKITDTLQKPAPRRVLVMDSTIYKGTYNGRPLITLNNTGYCIQKVTINDEPVSDIYHDLISINLSKMRLKKGAPLTLKVVYKKGGSIRLAPNGGMDVSK